MLILLGGNMLTNYELQYMQILRDIYEKGYEDGTNERTGFATKRLPCRVITIDLGIEFPILRSKKVFHKSAEKEILWIWQKMSNNTGDLDAHIWDEWADKYGSIGAAYGAQVRKPVIIYTDPVHKTPESFRAYKNQTEFILEYLREFPNGRWANATLWNVNDLWAMNLVPCCHTVTWNLDGGRLNCVLDQRSGDMPLGVPFNTTQYAMLTCMFAKDLGVQPGILVHVITDAHIYANQMEGVKHQLDNYDILRAVTRHTKDTVMESGLLQDYMFAYNIEQSAESFYAECLNVVSTTPTFVIKEDTRSFWDMSLTNAYVDNYRSLGKVEMGDVAV